MSRRTAARIEGSGICALELSLSSRARLSEKKVRARHDIESSRIHVPRWNPNHTVIGRPRSSPASRASPIEHRWRVTWRPSALRNATDSRKRRKDRYRLQKRPATKTARMPPSTAVELFIGEVAPPILLRMPRIPSKGPSACPGRANLARATVEGQEDAGMTEQEDTPIPAEADRGLRFRPRRGGPDDSVYVRRLGRAAEGSSPSRALQPRSLTSPACSGCPGSRGPGQMKPRPGAGASGSAVESGRASLLASTEVQVCLHS